MKHITEGQRYEIRAYRDAGWTQAHIAARLGLSQGSISKELRRNRNDHGHYLPAVAQELADLKKARPKRRKLTKDMEARVVQKITEEQWSPEEIVGAARKAGVPMVSAERIYQLVRADKALGGTLWQHMRHRLKHRRRPVSAGVGHIPHRTSIHRRPAAVEERKRIGDWEMDLIQSASGKEFIITLVERRSRYLLMAKLPNGKNAEDTAKAAIRLLNPHRLRVRTITTDNGGEFARHEDIAKKPAARVYFADPYASWQKGTVENTNKLIRQYIKKGDNFESLTKRDIKLIQNKLNQRPRKVLNFDTPEFFFFGRQI